ncbi:nucleoid-associated protein [Arcicella sp. LKC2W]|uniref:nucleoid-associated protein n=1 Tax=Arcicella sp. LKC2W TaxID=2984198 RepID=UPI002B1F4EE4|nr:nucleoid-associated protein [Arcicella sp. LKC2W]MEA5460606.1 nucleoid-associated protein [Arcicella sp. LKC2W]
MLDIANSTFHRIITHKILPKTNELDASVEEYESILSVENEIIDILKTRINDACGQESKSFNLEISDSTEKSFYNYSHNLRELDDTNFINRSKQIAWLLAESQDSKRVPGGYLIIIDASDVDNKKIIITIKVELHEALISTQDENKNSKIEVIKNIFLSPSGKFYKIGILFQKDKLQSKQPNDCFGSILYDDQFRPGLQPAEYFYSKFLGFSIANNDKLQTKDFYDRFIKIIESNITDYSQQRDLIVFLKGLFKLDKTGLINPKEIGEKFIDENLRKAYNNEILSRFPRSFIKNNTLINFDLKKRKLCFLDKVKIEAPEDVFEENISIINSQEELDAVWDDKNRYTIIKIKGLPNRS